MVSEKRTIGAVVREIGGVGRGSIRTTARTRSGFGSGVRCTVTSIDLARAAVVHNGFEWSPPRELQSTNALVLHIEPVGVVVKVGQWPDSQPGMLREHAVCKEMSAVGVAAPRPLGEPFTGGANGMVATLWAYLESTQVSSADAGEVSDSLEQAHRALQRTATSVPDYRHWLDLFAASLFDDDEMSNLDVEGRNDLRTAYNELRARLDSYPSSTFRLHGDPHLGNFLRVSNDLVLIDFETVCTGPPEWDLASLDPSVAHLYSTTIDEELLGLLRIMNNVRVATWSFVNPTPAEHELGRRCLKLVRARRP